MADYQEFFFASLLINLIPGTDRVFISSTTIQFGHYRALIALLGISLAIFTHSLIGATGLTVLVSQAPRLLFFLRLLGIAAVFVICFRFWHAPLSKPEESLKTLRAGFWEGFTVHLFNPMALVFAFTFIPNFIKTGNDFFWQFISLSAISNCLSFLINGLTIVLLSKIKKLFSSFNERYLRTIASLMLMALAIKLLVDLFQS